MNQARRSPSMVPLPIEGVAWLAWAGGTIGLWTILHWPLCQLSDLWPPGLGAALARGLAAGVASSPLLHLFVPLTVGFLGLVAGLAVVRAIAPPRLDEASRLGFAASFGLGLVGTAIALAALVRCLSTGSIAAVVAGLGMAGALAGWGKERGPASLMAAVAGRALAVVREEGLAGWVGLTLVASGLALSLAKALVPPWYPDALYYQLTVPRLYLEAGGFVSLPHMPITSGYPGLSQMLFASALCCGWDDVAAVFSWFHLPILLLATGLVAHRVAGQTDPTGARRTALLAVLGLAAVPQLLWVASVPLVDVATAAHLTFALYATVRATEAGSTRWAVMAAISAGFALANKYLAAPGAILLFGVLVARIASIRGWRGGMRTAAVVALFAAMPFAPWAIRNQLDWGSPFFPLHLPAGLDAPTARLVRTSQAAFAANSQHASLVWVPIDLTFAAQRDDMAAYQGEIGPLPLALFFLPLVLVGPRPLARWMGVYTAVLFIVWGGWTRQVRFLFPLLPPFFAACLGGRPRASPIRTAVTWATIVALTLGLAWFVGYGRPGYDLPYLGGSESRASYYRTLSATSSLWEACEALGKEPAGSRVMLFWEYRGYLCPRPFLPEHVDVLFDLPRDPRAALDRIRTLGVTHLLVNRTIWQEVLATGNRWPFQETLTAILASDAVRQVALPTSADAAQQVELYRLQP